MAKTKLHHHRKPRTSRVLARLEQNSADIWDLDHDRPDPDLQLLRIERSPKQENL
jgi:hypothetical protein